MENLNDLLGSVLNDPASMEKLRETARQLGLDTSEGSSAGKLNEEDDMTRLIHALKPYLSGARLKRAEEADRIVSIMRVIPLLRQSRQEEQQM